MYRYLRLLTTTTAVVIVAAASPVRAQGVTGSAITGTISAEGLGPIQGAQVRLKNTSTGDTFNAVTDASGSYFIDNVPAGGPYTLSVSAEAYKGYKAETRRGIQATLGQRVTVDLELGLQLEEAEEIVIEERIDPLQDRARSGPSTTVTDRAISALPLQGRNFTDLTVTSPQASSVGGGTSIGGQNNRFNNIQIDGGANNDLFGLAASGTPGGQAAAKPISIEAVREFQIQVAPFDVRQGSFTGGLVNAVTKSGTNEFRGSLFSYYQNKSLAGDRGHDEDDQNTFRDDLLDYSVWQLGGTLGGPIIKDKLHFFVSADLQERETSFGGTSITGNDAEDLARLGFTQATANRFVSILQDTYGIENPGTAAAPKLGNPDRNVFAKISTNVIPASRLELSYNLVDAEQDNLLRAPTSTTVPGRLRDGYQLSNAGYAQANTTHTGRVKLTSNFLDGKLSNELLAGVSIIRDERALPNRFPLILVKGCNSDDDCDAGAGRVGSADSFLAAGAERFSHENLLDQDVYQIQDNLTLGVGRHRITAGTSNEFFNIKNTFFQAAFGVWAFDNLDAFEAGTPSAYQRRFGVEGSGQTPGTADFNVAQLGFYLQDEWSIFKNLTINGGVRVDIPFLSDAVTNPVLIGTPLNIDTGEVPSGNPLWSPRIGFNWNVDGDADTVVRGGTGIFSGRPPYVWVSNAYSINGLAQREITCTATNGVPTFSIDANNQPTACGMDAPGNPNQGEIDYFDPDTKYPQNWRIALGVDRRLPWGLVGTVDLLYTQDVNGWYITDENLMTTGESSEGRVLHGTLGTNNVGMPNQSLSARATRIDTTNLNQAVKVYNKNGGKVYNGTVQISRPFYKDYEFSVAYTLSRAEDRISMTSSQALSNFQFSPIDGSIFERNVRPSAFDRTHKISVSGSARLPAGFNVGVIYVGGSGTPYTWTVNGDVNADGINGNDVVFVPAAADQITLRDPGQFGDLDAFIDSQDCLKNARGRFIKRGECRNPFAHNVNVRLGWGIDTNPGQRLEVQWDIFNILNLIDSDWGITDQAAQFENHGAAFLRAVGYDTDNNRPIYTFAAPVNATTGESTVVQRLYTPTVSRWRMQIGARYLF